MVEGRSPLCRRGQNGLLVYVSLLFLERFEMGRVLNLNVYLVTRICAVRRTRGSLKGEKKKVTVIANRHLSKCV